MKRKAALALLTGALFFCPPVFAATLLRIACGGPGGVDAAGNVWQSDAPFASGGASWNTSDAAGKPFGPVPYNHLRYSANPAGSPFTLALYVAPGSYSLTLKFMEPNKTGPNQRAFSVSINGSAVIGGLDLWATAGLLKAADYAFPVVVPSDGLITIALSASVGNAVLSGIQIDGAAAPRSVIDVFRTGHQQAFTLTNTPARDGRVWVFLNGLLQLAGEDYTISGASLTFTGQVIGDTPTIQVHYSTAN